MTVVHRDLAKPSIAFGKKGFRKNRNPYIIEWPDSRFLLYYIYTTFFVV